MQMPGYDYSLLNEEIFGLFDLNGNGYIESPELFGVAK